ncbi:MFS transporter [Blastococcus tunisiensis]|uniref:Major Facilitator Superfamily protein n=1 Tax=Blastococcus tunisiensis TaxID=1798228 RepID=A0A1I2H6E8_9ACTN|nr:MFS transporter [Blastococcus sp. DSM 46838]SFF24943.1 Major Facilitator Superfamily protein [Blastococcus sp. DSM 46838]
MLPLCAGAVLNPVNSTVIATALSPIGSDLGVGSAATAWLVAVMYLASAIGQPVAGRLADQFGPRRVFLAGGMLVATAGVLGALAPTFAWLVASRALVGLGTGAAYPAAIAMLREQADRLGVPTPPRTLGLLSTVSLVTLTVGPPLGGVLVDTIGWRAVFAINVPLGLAVTALGFLLLPRSRPRVRTVAAWRLLDLPGTALFGGAVALFLLITMELPRPPVQVLLGFAACVVLLVLVELRARTPFIDLRMLASNPALVIAYLRVFVTFLVVYGVLFGLTPWLQDSRGLSASTAGLVLLGMSAVAATASFVGVRGRRLIGPLLVGALGLLAGSAGMLLLHADSPIALLVLVSAVFGLPNGLGLVANQVLVYRAAPADQVGAAAGLFRTAQYTGAMTATGVVALAYVDGASDSGLQLLGWVSVGTGALLIVLTVADRGLRRHIRE